MKQVVTALLLISAAAPFGLALSSNLSSRRNFFKVTTAGLATATSALSPSSAFALDMDAFMNNAIQQDAPKEISDDERTCKYAAPGRERGAACERAGMSTKVKGSGVDAYGNIDRGDFVRCTTTYPIIDGQYVKTVTCE